jgi:2-deoxy-D-gluconate 3-dehydrogenase
VNKKIAKLFDLSNNVAIVTGGAMGIGKGIVMRLVEAGASIVISDINIEAANKTVEEVTKLGGKAKAIFADARVVGDAQKVVDFAIREFGDLHILVNNAGIFRFIPALEVTEATWNNHLDTNVKSVMFQSQAAATAMIKKNHGGKIINLASINSFRPNYDFSAYDTSKAAVAMLTKSLAKNYIKHGIRVNAIAPGVISTPGVDASGVYSADKIPSGRYGTPDDVGILALYLASDASDYMVGSIVLIDGGNLLVSP